MGIVIHHEDFERLALRDGKQAEHDERLIQLLPGYGLLHDRRGAERKALVAIRHDRNDHDRDVPQRRHLLKASEEVPPVHAGQQDVQGDQRQRLLHRENQRGLGGGGMQYFETLRLEVDADQVGGLEVVFHHQRHACSRRRRDTARDRPSRRREHRCFRRMERQPDREAGALANGTFHHHRAVVQLDELSHHGQAQSRAFEFSCQSAVYLAKGPEQLLQSLQRDADAAVGDADLDELRECALGQREGAAIPGAGQMADFAPRDAAGVQCHLAVIAAELDRVGEQVVHDLLDLARVRLNRTQFLGRLHIELDVPVRGFLPDDGEAVREQRRQLHRLQVERHLARFHLGQVEDVVDQGEQMRAAAEDIADEAALCIGQLAGQSVPEHLGKADNGVQRCPQFV